MAVAVDGDLAGVSSEIDRILSSDDVSAKEVSDAAVALAYLQAKADRRCIGQEYLGSSMASCYTKFHTGMPPYMPDDACPASCRLWGKVFERAAAVKASFDAASLTSFLWAATTAGVEHFKTVRVDACTMCDVSCGGVADARQGGQRGGRAGAAMGGSWVSA